MAGRPRRAGAPAVLQDSPCPHPLQASQLWIAGTSFAEPSVLCIQGLSSSLIILKNYRTKAQSSHNWLHLCPSWLDCSPQVGYPVVTAHSRLYLISAKCPTLAHWISQVHPNCFCLAFPLSPRALGRAQACAYNPEVWGICFCSLWYKPFQWETRTGH